MNNNITSYTTRIDLRMPIPTVEGVPPGPLSRKPPEFQARQAILAWQLDSTHTS